MPSSLHRPIQIRFLRRGRADPDTDDVLRIHKIDRHTVRCDYMESRLSSSAPPVTESLTTMLGQLPDYLMRVFYMLSLDEDPFESVQFFIPAYPTVLVSVASLRQHTQTLMMIVMATCWSWPRVSRPGGPPSVEDGEMEGQSEETGETEEDAEAGAEEEAEDEEPAEETYDDRL